MSPMACAERDLLRGPSCWLLWGVPAALVALGSIWEPARPWLWTVGLALAGGACLANARRCGRRHCFLTGPVFLLAALASLLRGLGWAALGWSAILSLALAALALGCALECLQGRYTAPN